MKKSITGSDDLSKKILIELEGGLRVFEVPELYPISLDQAKRLSRYRTMLQLGKQNLEEHLYCKLEALGMKSLPLSHLFRRFDWAGITEILTVVTDETTRLDLQLLVDGLNEKRNRITEFKENTDLISSELEEKDRALHISEKELLTQQRDLNEKIKLFKVFPEPIRSFLHEYLGLHEGELILARKIDSNWIRMLMEKGILLHIHEQDLFIIKDFNALIDYLRAMTNLNYSSLKKVNEEIGDTLYNLSSPYAGPILESKIRLEQDLNEIQKKRSEISNTLRYMKQKAVRSYKELADVPELLSPIHMKQHKELQDKVLRWLFERGFVAVVDFPLPNGRKVDIFAYDESQIVIFEVKVSNGDILTDKTWTDCLLYCHDFYFLTPPGFESLIAEAIGNIDCGHYVDAEDHLKLIKPDGRSLNEIEQQEELKFAAGRLLSKKFMLAHHRNKSI